MTGSQATVRGAVVGVPFALLLALGKSAGHGPALVAGLGLGIVFAVLIFVWATNHDRAATIGPDDARYDQRASGDPLDAIEGRPLRVRVPPEA